MEINNVNLYKRGVNNKVIVWNIELGKDTLIVRHGCLNGKIAIESIPITMTDGYKECESRVKAKRKEGYVTLQEVKDSANTEPNPCNLYDYLNAYLPKYNSANNGNILPMLCKTLDSNRPFEKTNVYYGQWKINGLRCLIGAEKSEDLFSPIRLKFQSREGTTWQLPYLEAFMLDILSESPFMEMMLEENAYLDGEIYLPGHTVNEINHFVKDPTAHEHSQLQYWCYDIAVENTNYKTRARILVDNFSAFCLPMNHWYDKNEHLNNQTRFIVLKPVKINSYNDAIRHRDSFINLGFEGLVMRNIYADYQFGGRKVDTMYKFKKIDDGWFKIVDIVPEGKKRQDLAKFILKNDINDEQFECTYNGTQNEQRMVLECKEQFIGGEALVEFRERSGVKQVPFHAKAVSYRP